MNNQDQAKKTISQEVKSLRLSATKNLKIRFVNKLVELIKKYTAKNDKTQKQFDKNETRIKVKEYETKKTIMANTEHPQEKEKNTKLQTKLREYTQKIDKENTELEKETEKNAEKIKEWKIKIDNVNSGKTKFKTTNINKETEKLLERL